MVGVRGQPGRDAAAGGARRGPRAVRQLRQHGAPPGGGEGTHELRHLPRQLRSQHALPRHRSEEYLEVLNVA